MWLAVWLATVAASGLAVFGSWQLTSETFESKLEESLDTQVAAQVAMAAASLDQLPLESVVALEGDRSLGRLREELGQLQGASGLHDLALIGPGGQVLSETGTRWTPAEADQALIARARQGETISGPLYQGSNGEVYLAAYAPIPDHAGWVAAVEGSGAPLEAAEDMETILAWGSVLVMLVAAAAGALLAAAATRPLGRLAQDLAAVRPGDAPGSVALRGPREVRLVASAARSLLDAVRGRDEALRATHDREVQQVSALAAAVAHEVRNPLNAIGLAVQRLDRVEGSEAAGLRGRIRNLLADIEGIVERFMDLSKPPEPALRTVLTTELWEDLAVDTEALGVRLDPPTTERQVRTDPSLVRQALRNLVRNAAEAGAHTVTIRVSRQDPMVLEVSDDGPGIPPDQADRLFEWFHTTRAQGSGLGLPSARRALRALGGEVELLDAERSVFLVAIEGEKR